MITPMAAAEFIPEPGQAPPEPASIVPDILGLRAVPLSPAQRRDDLRDRYAREAYGRQWVDLSRAQQATLESGHPDLMAAAGSAIETYARRGSLLHQFQADVAALREEPERQIGALAEQLRRGELSGYDYRRAVQEREAEMARLPEQLQRTEKYRDVPLKEEEWAKWAERTGQPMAERLSPVDQFIDQWYQLTADRRDPTTGEVNAADLVKAREALKAQTDPAIVQEAMAYLNRNRHPELVQAQEEFAEYMRIPKYRGLTPEQGEEADRIARFVAAYSKQLGSPERAKALASKVFGRSFGYYMLSRRDAYQNPEWRRFRQAHPLIDKYYSPASTVEFRELVPAAVGR